MARLFPVFILLSLSCLASLVQGTPSNDKTRLAAAYSLLDHFLEATQNQDFEKASQLLLDFDRYSPRARHFTRMTYKRHREFFEASSITNIEPYGAAFRKDLLRNDVVQLEGLLTASNSIQKEYKAEIVRYRKRWLIRSIEID